LPRLLLQLLGLLLHPEVLGPGLLQELAFPGGAQEDFQAQTQDLGQLLDQACLAGVRGSEGGDLQDRQDPAGAADGHQDGDFG